MILMERDEVIRLLRIRSKGIELTEASMREVCAGAALLIGKLTSEQINVGWSLPPGKQS